MSENHKHELASKLAQFREMADSVRKALRRETNESVRREYQLLVECWDQLIKEIEKS